MLKKILAILAMLYAMSAFAAVDVNKASAADLDSVKGIGPAMSAKIIEERKKGPFKDWNDLVSRVKGIGETSAAKLSEAGLTVNGAAYPGAPAKAEAKPAKTDAKAAAADDKKAKEEAKAPAAEEKKAKAEAKQAKASAAAPVASAAKK
jgi:competence protein ComEA